ncbi:hypothetical protein N7470_005342 [Penicillium chermesinum]|nr:hypothetical protein N7470_005342 [Penicillium chermesinum]
MGNSVKHSMQGIVAQIIGCNMRAEILRYTWYVASMDTASLGLRADIPLLAHFKAAIYPPIITVSTILVLFTSESSKGPNL